ncbi:ZIP family metal transporter [uncultured Sphingomonas sp.]|uniref:ZIP family metal transporter n=1 Tax=uncultured Sphingomonas sp. TaxID=158754 RepID=UPI00262108EF|nr:ZIP family metal transporter [uncultured Sphingomonas sp.]
MSTIWPLLSGSIAGLATYAGGLLAMRLSRHRLLIFGLTAGLLIGLSLFHLLPETLHSGDLSRPRAWAAMTAGFLAFAGLHRIPSGALFGRLSMLLHSLMDGLGIGLAFHASSSAGWAVTAAILAHKLADGANMVGLAMASSAAHATHRWLLASALAPVLGACLGAWMPVGQQNLALMLALFAGGFLYLGACELLPRSRITANRPGGALAALAGLAIMAGVMHFLHQDREVSARDPRPPAPVAPHKRHPIA